MTSDNQTTGSRSIAPARPISSAPQSRPAETVGYLDAGELDVTSGLHESYGHTDKPNSVKLPTPLELGFHPVARFVAREQLSNIGRKNVMGSCGERITFLVSDDEKSRALFDSTDAATYMWIEAGYQHPFYVGKASFGMKKRAAQHEGGFHGTAAQRAEHERRFAKGDRRDVKPGLGHARRIRQLWAAPNGRRELELWVRPSDYVEVFGGRVSLAAAEEERLIAMFKPAWNREHKSDEFWVENSDD